MQVSRKKINKLTINHFPDYIFSELDILEKLESKKVQLVPRVTEIRESTVVFENGEEEKIDAIIYATGYKTEFPFLSISEIDQNLFQDVFYMENPTLCFVGLVTFSCLFPNAGSVEKYYFWHF